MSEVKAIKVSKETYAKLCEFAGELQVNSARFVSALLTASPLNGKSLGS